MGDTPEFRYTTLGLDQDARAGIMDGSGFLGDGGSRWQFYLQCPDTDESLARAVATGGQVEQAAQDSPYGRIATLTDPAGLRLCVMGPNTEG